MYRCRFHLIKSEKLQLLPPDAKWTRSDHQSRPQSHNFFFWLFFPTESIFLVSVETLMFSRQWSHIFTDWFSLLRASLTRHKATKSWSSDQSENVCTARTVSRRSRTEAPTEPRQTPPRARACTGNFKIKARSEGKRCRVIQANGGKWKQRLKM